MADNTAKRAALLHIGPESSATSGADPDVVRALSHAPSNSIERCPDAYRALARLCRPDAPTVSAVVVCMDQLGTPELEFFSILSRMGSRPQVYVYGAPRSRNRIARAIQLGAAGEATEEIINRLLRSLPSRAAEATPAHDLERADASATSSPREPTPAPQSPMPETERVTRPPRRDHNERHEDSVTARVPWIEYPDRPSRGSPVTERSTPDQHDRTTPPAGSDEPLLTDEELRALIGDDLDPYENGGLNPGERS